MSDMDLIRVDQGKCIRCGLCVSVCRGVLGMGDDGPEMVRPLCIGCGQCVAVCPQAAIDNAKSPLANQTVITVPILDADTVAQFLRSRRSIRDYQQKAVPREKIHQMLDVARMAPTACNSQGIAYHVIDNSEILREIAAVIIKWTEGELKRDSAMSASPWAPNAAAQIEIYHQTAEDVALRSAPCLIIAMADKNFRAPVRDNAYISLTYAQLSALSLGLGTCWAGLFEYCASCGHKPLLDLLDLPENMQVISGMMVGYPKYNYKRLVDRHPLQVTWQNR